MSSFCRASFPVMMRYPLRHWRAVAMVLTSASLLAWRALRKARAAFETLRLAECEAQRRSLADNYKFPRKRVCAAEAYGEGTQLTVDTRTGAEYVLCTLPKQGASSGGIHARRVMLPHPNIVGLHELLDDGTNLYVILEKCSGPALSAVGRLTEVQAAHVMRSLLSAIAHLHSSQIYVRKVSTRAASSKLRRAAALTRALALTSICCLRMAGGAREHHARC